MTRKRDTTPEGPRRRGRPKLPFLEDRDLPIIALLEASAAGEGTYFACMSRRKASRLFATIMKGNPPRVPPWVAEGCPDGYIPVAIGLRRSFADDKDTRPDVGVQTVSNAADYYRQKARKAWADPAFSYIVNAVAIMIRNPTPRGIEVAKGLIELSGKPLNVDEALDFWRSF
jgi:hypothetical protein